jgi:hypothetical protein
MKKTHIKKVKPVKVETSSVVKTRETGIACIPFGEPPNSAF